MIVHGSTTVPGDKSLTHRALYLAARAPGRSTLHGALTSLDARSTAGALRRMGVAVSPMRPGRPIRVTGGKWRAPDVPLDCGNSGTTARLGLGLLAAEPFRAVLTGDKSLRRRPMRRVTDPLAAMGAHFDLPPHDGLPLAVRGGRLRPLEWRLPASSAQLKGALLFAGMAGGVAVRVREPAGRSRDHTERMLRWFGYAVTERHDGWIDFQPGGRLAPFEWRIPGDISSAAFLLGVATLAQRGELRLEAVGVNPTRTGFLDVLGRMGGAVTVENRREWLGEPLADLIAGPARLRATEVRPREVPGLIDEIPMLAVLASRAEGTTMFLDVGELRVKESDRLALIASNLRTLGVAAATTGDTLTITGTDRPPRGRVVTEGDHRIAMAFAVLALLPGAKVHVDNMACAEVSFPGFVSVLRSVVRAR
jgi:3-phosphoshikimate 1-carboxyvinyltransferase